MNKIQERPIEEIHPNNIEEIIKGSLSDLEKE